MEKAFSALEELQENSPESNPSFIKIANFLTADRPCIPRLSILQEETKAKSKPSKRNKKGLPRRRSLSFKQNQSRPASAKPFKTNRSRQASSFAQAASNSVIKSIYSFLSNKYPSAPSVLNPEDQREIELFFHSKASQFKKLLQKQCSRQPLAPFQISKREKLRMKNKANQEKQEMIRKAKEEQEIERSKKANIMRQENEYQLIQKEIQEEKKRILKQKKIQKTKQQKEIRKLTQQQKQFIVENIQNFYNDKIREVRQQLEQHKFNTRILNSERKKNKMQNSMRQKQSRKKQFQDAISLLDQQNQNFRILLQKNSKFLQKRLRKPLNRK